MRPVAEVDKELRERGFTGSLSVEYVGGEPIEAAREWPSVPMEDQADGLAHVARECKNGEVVVSWRRGVVCHVEVRDEAQFEPLPDERLVEYLQFLAGQCFHGQTTIRRRAGRTVGVEDRKGWKMERFGQTLRVLRDREG